MESQLHNPSKVVDNHQHREPVTETIANHIGESNEHEQPGSTKQQFSDSESRYLSEAESDNHHEEHDGDSGVYRNDESGSSGKTSTNSGCHVTVAVMDDSHHKDPVYDSSPASSSRFLSFRSVSSDTLQEILEMSSPPAVAELPVIKSELQPDIANNDSSHHKEIVEGYLPKEMEVKSPEDEEVNDDGLVNHEDGVDHLNYDSQNGSTKAGPDIQHALVTLRSLASDAKVDIVDQDVYKEVVYAKEKSSPHLEKWYSWSDKSMVESSSDIHDVSLVIYWCIHPSLRYLIWHFCGFPLFCSNKFSSFTTFSFILAITCSVIRTLVV